MSIIALERKVKLLCFARSSGHGQAAAVRRWSSASVRGAWLSFDLGDRGEPGLWLAPGKGVEQARRI